jgi:hypothetical protein
VKALAVKLAEEVDIAAAPIRMHIKLVTGGKQAENRVEKVENKAENQMRISWRTNR